MRNITTVLISIGCLMLLSSCHKTADRIFGGIPSIYENEMMNVTKEAQEQAKDPAAIKNIMVAKLDSAFKIASQSAQSEAESLQGQYVDYTIDNGLDLMLTTPLKIDHVVLPQLSVTGNGMMSVVLACDVTTRSNKLYYILEGEEGNISCGIFSIGSEDEDKERHVDLVISAPNIPAKYQERCKSIRFVLPSTFFKELNGIKVHQLQWSREYKKDMQL